MKSDSNTEMDLLLRRHARRRSSFAPGAGDAASPSDDRAATSGTHLDADEMNAYAEGMLPAAARAQALSHIADCDRCRALVTSLTLSANVPVREQESDEQLSASPKRSWRAWLAALFAPPVIRYGVPALVALCVVGVVFLALRQRDAERQNNEPTFVAQNNRREEQTGSAIKPEGAQPPATTAPSTTRAGEQPTPAQPKEEEAARSRGLADTQPLAKTKEENDATPAGVTKTDEPAPAPVTSNESPRQETTARDQRDEDVLAANRPAAPPASMSQPSAGARAPEPKETDKLSQNRKDSGPSDDRSVTTVTSNTTSREAEVKTGALGRASQATEARRRAARRAEATTEGADERAPGGAGARSNETRSVGGRNFRRQGSAWVDTAYAQGRATVNVTRGSDQYRALVADEPGLRAIADQLGGEVIVVWRGRAYRIR